VERDEQIASMARQIEDLKRKAEQGSQQLQGEVQELELEALLQSRFPPASLLCRCDDRARGGSPGMAAKGRRYTSPSI
jgi:hypothetical protein